MDEIARDLQRVKELALHPPADVRHIPPELTGEEAEHFNRLRAETFSQQVKLFRQELAEHRARWQRLGITGAGRFVPTILHPDAGVQA